MKLIITQPITANGDYDHPVTPGRPHMFALKGTFGSATVTMSIRSGVTGVETYDSVTGGSWTAEAEDTLIPSGDTVRLTITGATGSTSIRVSIIPIHYKV